MGLCGRYHKLYIRARKTETKMRQALHRFTSILDIYVLIDKNIYSQLKRFCQRKKPEMNIGKSQRGTVRRNLNSKYSCWIMHICNTPNLWNLYQAVTRHFPWASYRLDCTTSALIGQKPILYCISKPI